MLTHMGCIHVKYDDETYYDFEYGRKTLFFPKNTGNELFSRPIRDKKY